MPRGYPDHEGNKVALYTKAEWAAYESLDKQFHVALVNQAPGNGGLVSYAVPAGKTLYITGASSACVATADANADNEQHFDAYGVNVGATIAYFELSGNGGAVLSLNKPSVVAPGVTVRMFIINRSNHNCDLTLIVWGYER